MTDDLITWLRARFDDDERVAREATPGPWRWVDPGGKVKSALVGPGYPYQTVVPVAGGDVYPSKYDAEHIALHDPARVLAEVDAKRRIMAIHNRRADVFPGATGGTFDNCCDGCGYEGICDDPVTEDINDCPVLRLLALPYADRPGYRPEWKL